MSGNTSDEFPSYIEASSKEDLKKKAEEIFGKNGWSRYGKVGIASGKPLQQLLMRMEAGLLSCGIQKKFCP